MRTFVIGDVHGRREQLRRLVGMLPRDPARESLVLLGDLVDRCEDVPGTVEEAIGLCRPSDGPCAPVVVLRGNHEQMLLDFLDHGARLWLHAAVGGRCTFRQYTGRELNIESEDDIEEARSELAAAIPPEHVEFFRQMPLYHEDRLAIYVHAGLDPAKHPSDTPPRQLLWSRDQEFFRNYRGKPCVFGHTPTQLLPVLGRIGHHGIYLSHSAIGIDTGYLESSPLTCLQLPEFILYQTFADGRSATHQVHHFMPAELRGFVRYGDFQA